MRCIPRRSLSFTLVFIVCVVSSGRYDVAGLTVYFFYPLVLIALGELPPIGI
jgi:cobalt/nickel transport system permease protein